MTPAELHKRISYIKSAVRILGYLVLPLSIYGGALILVASELFGILEEDLGA